MRHRLIVPIAERFDELGIGAQLVDLAVEEEPALSEDVLGVDDARRLLVLRDEVRAADRTVEELRVRANIR